MKMKKREKKSDGRWGCVQRTKNGSYCEKKKMQGGGVRVDVNGEVKLL